MTRRIPAYICIVFLALAMKIAKAQSGQDLAPHVGFDPYGTFQSSKIDNVNILNGNVVVKIPLLSLPQRGAFKPITYSLINNSMPWTPSSYFDGSGNGYYYANPRGQSGTGPDGMVIRPDTLPASGADISILSFTNDIPDPQEAIQWSVTDYSGASHPAVYNWNDPSELRTLDGSKFRLKFQDFSSGGHTYSEPYFYTHNYDVGFGIDPSYYPSQDLHNVQPDLYDSSGIRTIRAPLGGATQTVIGYTDQDGNVLTVPSLVGAGTDTVGRTIFSGWPSSYSTTDVGSHCPDLGFGDQPAHHYAVISLVDIYGTTTPDPRYTYTVCYAMINFRTNIWQNGGTSDPASEGVIGYIEGDSINPYGARYGPMGAMQSVVLPDGTHWGFVYDNVTSSTWGTAGYVATGMLTKVITPEGGAISYCYDGSYLFSATKDQRPASMPLLTKRWEQATAGTNRDACSAPAHTYWSYQLYPWGGTYNSTSTASDKVIDPAGNETDYTYDVGGETSETVYQGCASGTSDTECGGTGSVLKATTITNGYTALPVPYGYDNEQPSYSSYPIATSTSLNGTMVGNTASDYQGDFRGTAWVCSALGSHPPDPPSSCLTPIGSTGTSYLVGQPHHTYTYQGAGTGTLLQSVTTTVQAAGSGTYWDNNFLDLPSSVTTSDSLGNSLVTSYGYDASGSIAGGMGHLTSTTTGGLTSYKSWTTWGAPLTSTDPKGNTTTYGYNSGSNYLFPDYMTYPNAAIPLHDWYTHDPTSGALTSRTDANGNATTYSYDNAGRPWKMLTPDASSGGTQVACYPSATQVKVYQATGATGAAGLSSTLSSGLADGSACPGSATAIVKIENVDGLGRKISDIVATSGTADIKVDTSYDSMGRVLAVSNPYLTSGSASVWTVSHYDSLSRPTDVFEGSTSISSPNGDVKTMSYSGLTTTAADEALNKTVTTTDFLGRTTDVYEPTMNNSTSAMLHTGYTYNLYGLTGICQYETGATCELGRSFSYDSLGRLYQTTNPETGTITYSYLNGSALCSGDLSLPCSKTDARGVVVNYSYDTMNRLTEKKSLGATGIPGFDYGYYYDWDYWGFGDTNTKGHLVNASGGVSGGGSNYGYDKMGRIIHQGYYLASAGYWNSVITTAAYDQAGHMTSVTYPNGTTVNQDFDSTGRLTKVSSGMGTSEVDYLASASYFPNGSPSLYTYGNGVTESFSQNNRLQTTAITAANSTATLMDRTYSYAPSDGLSGSCATTSGSRDTGSIWKITDNRNSAWTRQFQYDCMDRLTSAKIGSATTDYWLDSFGNMSPKASGSPVSTFSASTNRTGNLPCHASGGLPDFDAAGDQLCDTDPLGAHRKYIYDAEGKTVSMTISGGGSPVASYRYDGESIRTRKDNADLSWLEYLHFGAMPIAEKDNHGHWTNYIYAGDKKIAKVDGSPNVMHLGGSNVAGTGLVSTGVEFSGLNGVTIQSGDTLSLWQYTVAENSQKGGMWLHFTNGDYSTSSVLGWITDQDGQSANLDGITGQWHKRIIDLSVFHGLTIDLFRLLNERLAPGATGRYDVYFADVALTRADGTVIPVWTGSPAASTETVHVYGPGSATITADGALPVGADSSAIATHYYLDDHLGTAQYELSAVGWPVWAGQFDAWGKELTDPVGTTFHYKFTGKERDKETGLDYFGARYYASTMGRWMSADWADKPEAVPYSILTDPQSLNLYSYVRNHPVNTVDVDGHLPLLLTPEVITYVEEGLGKLVDEGAAAGAAMIAEAGGGASVAGSARWGLLAGPAIILGAMIHPATVSAGDNPDGEHWTDPTGNKSDTAPANGGTKPSGNGRGEKQARLRQLANDDKVSSADRGQIKRDMNQIERGKRNSIRVPKGKQLAHRRGKEAKKGYGYSESDLQSEELHKLQHKHEGYK